MSLEKTETILELFARKSVRVYEPREIEPEAKRLILDSAIQAPSAGNMALYSIIDVTDQSVKARLAASCDNQPFIATAPMVLVFVADYQRWYDGFVLYNGAEVRTPSYGDFLLAASDALIAAQNAVVAAESLGIGSCYIGDILENFEVHQKLFDLPRFTAPVAMLCLGYPTPQQRQRKKPPRFAREELVFENSYRHADSADLERMFAGRGGAEHEINGIYSRKWTAAFTEEMTRSAALWLERWAAGEPEDNSKQTEEK